MPTGTPIIFASSGTVPGGLTAGTVYYAINTSSTIIKVATSALNASLGIAVDITSQGTGSHRVRVSYVFSNKDEIWGRGRKGKLTRYWNTDYRNPEASDWFKLPATLDAENDIRGVGKLSGRSFFFTENAMIRFDGANRLVLRNDVGCISQKTICYYETFMAWMDSKGQIWFRNEESGEMDILSLPVQNIIDGFSQEELKSATAVCVGPIMKVYIGKRDGRALRLVYHFQSNQWSEHWHDTTFNVQLEYKYEGYIKPFWFDEVGQMWVDDTGNTDNGKQISLRYAFGDDTFGIDELKSYKGIKVYSTAAVGTKVLLSIDRGEPIEVGEISGAVTVIDFSTSKKNLPKGSMVNVIFTNSSSEEAPLIEKATVYYQKEEDTLRATGR